jgi:rare lipoprotein A
MTRDDDPTATVLPSPTTARTVGPPRCRDFCNNMELMRMRMPRTLGVSLAALVVSSPAVTKQAHSADYPPEHAAKAKPGETGLTKAAERRHGVNQLAAVPTDPRDATAGRSTAGFGAPDRYIAAPPQRAGFQVVGRREIGRASWYGNRHVGRRTATGERLDSVHPTAAHRTLPLYSLVKVTNLNNGRSVVVTINDRGPVSPRLLIDVSPRAADELNMRHAGIVPVAIEQVAVARPQ